MANSNNNMSVHEAAHHPTFVAMVDKIVLLSREKPELLEKIQWVDRKAKERNISIYEMTFILIQQHLAESRAKTWFKQQRITRK